jgi:hypothetical protein
VKKLISTALVATFVFAAAFASASALTVQGGTIQVGADTTLACDSDGVTVTWNLRQDGVVTSANVADISANCVGQSLMFFALDGSGNIIGAGGTLTNGGDPVVYASLPISGPTMKVAIGAQNNDLTGSGMYTVPASAVEGVRIMIGV